MSKLPKVLVELYEQVVVLTEETREEFVNLLKNNILKVTFMKTNGELRVMRCTLKKDLLPPLPADYVPRDRAPNPNVVAALDLDKNEWRSFRIDSVKKYEIEQQA
jgi:WYL_2, Sm-like SH3 beta-barrel fold